MHVLTRAGWSNLFLDYACGPGQLRIRPHRWLCLAPVAGQYFERRANLRMLLDYCTEIGIRAVLTKIRSRLAEKHRNEKFIGVGAGRIEAIGPGASPFRVGDAVIFIATNHPRCVERIVVDSRLVTGAAEHVSIDEDSDIPDDCILFIDRSGDTEASLNALCQLAGWQPESGWLLPDADVLARLLRDAGTCLGQLDRSAGRLLHGASAATTERVARPTSVNMRRSAAVLVGYGNYAKTIVLPGVRSQLDIRAVHEIDPLQVPVKSHASVTWSTQPAPSLEDFSSIAAVLIAGWHHTHAGLAATALRHGAAAVIEKPVVTTRDELAALLDTQRETGGRIFSCFQRRYSPLNDWVRRDLAIGPGMPLSYHCIVYEEPLPVLHWYRWPNSRGRLVSNGCHWIDHFLFLNDFSERVDQHVYVLPDGTVNCSLALKNGASFSMVLTDRGANRVGMQNYIEVRTGNGTARIINDRLYEAETSQGRRRRQVPDRLWAHRLMYRQIARAIVTGEPGDSERSLVESANAMLDLEQRARSFVAYCNHGRPGGN